MNKAHLDNVTYDILEQGKQVTKIIENYFKCFQLWDFPPSYKPSAKIFPFI
jgi:hypothetical protein